MCVYTYAYTYIYIYISICVFLLYDITLSYPPRRGAPVAPARRPGGRSSRWPRAPSCSTSGAHPKTDPHLSPSLSLSLSQGKGLMLSCRGRHGRVPNHGCGDPAYEGAATRRSFFTPCLAPRLALSAKATRAAASRTRGASQRVCI